jgi:alpha-beta hydrolase superfamily lysophospholipase
VTQARPPGAEDIEFQGAGVKLRGWLFREPEPRRGTVIYLHGSADNRASGVWMAGQFQERGFDVLAYDSRAHGESEGDACTYGYYEKTDLSRAIDILPKRPVVVFGASLGAAVALQAAAHEPRIAAIVAVAPFSDLRTVVRERAPFFATTNDIERAFTLAEVTAKFRVDDVDCASAASSIAVPVLIIHGANDRETSVEHSRRIYGRLRGPKKLLVVPAAGHNDALRPEVWAEIDAWIDQALSIE